MASSQVPKLSETALGGLCKVCKEPEQKEKMFLICGHSLCMYKYYHIRCLSPEQIASKQQIGKQCWYCPSCLCRRCFCDMDDNKIIMCDGCDEAYHLYCLSPPLTSVPKRHWYCQFCTAAKAREKELKKYEKKMLQLHRKRDRAMVKSASSSRGACPPLPVRSVRRERRSSAERWHAPSKPLASPREGRLPGSSLQLRLPASQPRPREE